LVAFAPKALSKVRAARQSKEELDWDLGNLDDTAEGRSTIRRKAAQLEALLNVMASAKTSNAARILSGLIGHPSLLSLKKKLFEDQGIAVWRVLILISSWSQILHVSCSTTLNKEQWGKMWR
jgi:hypothetical protein